MSPDPGCVSVPVRRPDYFVPALVLLALLALYALYCSALAPWLKGLLCLALGFQLHHTGRRCPADGLLVLHEDGDAWLIGPDGRRTPGRLRGEQFVHQRLLALRLGSREQVYHLLFCPHPDGDALRQLRIRVQGRR